MKKINIILLLTAVMGFSSCKKDATVQNTFAEPKSAVNPIGQYNVGFDSLGWLVFDDRIHIVSTIEGLQISDENYDDQYTDCLDGIADEITVEQEESDVADCGYVEGQPILDFEASFGSLYTSIRAKMESDVDTWLNQQTLPLDFTTMPTNSIDDPYIGSVYNEFGEVQVGGIVYFTKPDGRQVGIERKYLNYEIIQNLRTLFSSASFDPNSYQSDPLDNDSLENAFLYGEQINAKRVSSKGIGTVVRIIIIIGTSPITVIWDKAKWLSNPSGAIGADCNMKQRLPSNNENEFEEWTSGSYKMWAYVKLSNKLVIGQWAKSQVMYFKGTKRKYAKMKIRADVDVFMVDNNVGCVTSIDLYRDLDKEKKRRKMSKIEAVGLYNQFAIHDNTPSVNYLYALLYKDGNQKIEIK